MEQVYEKKREQLLSDLSDMSEVAEEMLQNVMKALENVDVDAAHEVISRDDVVDNYLITIEEEVSRLLTLDQPLASDTWFSIAMIKIANDLERIGDQATNIAEILLELKHDGILKPLVMIPELADIVSDMLDVVLEAFSTRNADLAEAACRMDEKADNLYEDIYHKAIKMISKKEDREEIKHIVQHINLAKSLERVGDHATNIGEETIFFVTGKRVKY
ncbi:Phosphate transport system regulatory protein PhoU [Halanaerobium saccharolyticum subsp. saccharolyticum DSM 6643]|jgi:phosphate transport system protein|uniref:Phosphate-specific transport system accessory protein PhoU n=1 Tax=Halanaerobium saccharolyticum subsp. saccharolyticum DSM 6643 TaxID=1293054 RepID=M5E1J9_9FIRM|nr:phosphate signaling complex protein PhoU [Halanaerobium saccharolyticum]CCU79799.1 Phosphate transport system regulatory protein PhoU [Halanaerobium saccharolyticum subsp. saccharolyticum DSM 6643]